MIDLSQITGFDWDSGNARKNEKHGVSMAEAEQVFFNAPLLLLDDARGRYAAGHAKLPVLGTAGLLVLAKKATYVPAVKPLLAALRQSHYFLSDPLVAAVLGQAGEV